MRSLKILILEDNPFQLMAVHQMLNANQVFDVLTADSVAAAKRSLANRGEVDIAICDLQMEGPDGLEFIRHLADSGAARALIVLSSATDSVLEGVDRLARSQGLQVLGCLQKPATAAVLRQLLETYRWHARQPQEACCVAPETPLCAARLLTCTADGAVDVATIAQQWVVHFQPKVTLEGEVLGVEALVRWQHPILGLLAPGRFMTVLEREGLLAPLSWRVIEQALRFCADMIQHRGEPMPVAVNIPPLVLEQPDFAERIMALLAQYQVPAKALTLEVLEQDAGQPQTLQVEALLRLRMHGCRLSIDDFGTGASNIQRLLQLPFCELKIPTEFVRGMGDDPRKSAVVAGAMFIARRLALDVVIEGVETLDDFHSLMALGASAVQGYFVARPMPEADLLRWLAERKVPISSVTTARTVAQDNPCSCK